MGRRAKRPLNGDAVQAADDQFYADHPEFVQDGKRIPLDANDPAQADLRKEWMDLYEANGGEVEGGTTPSDPPPTDPPADPSEDDPANPGGDDPANPPTPTPDPGGSDPADPVVPCPLTPKGHLVVRILDDAGNPIESAIVDVKELGNSFTSAKGIADFGEVDPGTYNITAEKDNYIPEPAKKTHFVPANATTMVTLVLDPVEYHMHLDANRDGKVDDDYKGLDKWEWGKGKKGATILCNNDGDGTPARSDNEDDKVNAGNDRKEIAPLEFRLVGPKPALTWKATLEVDSAMVDKIRIFESRSAGAKQILGKGKGSKHNFPDLNFTKKEFGMEAVQYAGTGFDGEITLTFTVTRGNGTSYSEKGKVRVAPWIMPNHLDPAVKVYVVDSGGFNRRFRRKLERLVKKASCTLDESHKSNDIWMQDCMEWGYSSIPKNIGFRSVMRSPRDRPLKRFPKKLRKADFGYHEQGIPSDSTLNSSGNLEVSPPVTSKSGKKYPWGRIYYGQSMPGEPLDADLENFLKNQVVQEPIPIDTSWLLVAHVDEIISFVPSSKGKGFKMLLASPDLAYKILKDNKSKHPKAKLLKGREFPDAPGVKQTVTIEDLLDRGLTSLKSKFTNTYLEKFNKDVQSKIDSIKTKLQNELGLVEADIIEVPILYADIIQADLADALTAGMVNMLVINKHCIFPEPFGPVVGLKDLFQVDLEKKLKAEGLTPLDIDDWDTYHVNAGEVHCGTNTLRTPTFANWWEFKP